MCANRVCKQSMHIQVKLVQFQQMKTKTVCHHITVYHLGTETAFKIQLVVAL